MMGQDNVCCSKCRADLSVDDIVRDLRVAKCSQCGTVSRIDDLPDLPDAPSGVEGLTPAAPLREPSAPVAMPDRFDVLDIGEALQITYKWWGAKFIGLLIVAVFWNGFMVVWMGIALSQGQWAMAAFGTIHGSVGMFMIYAVVAGFKNTTTIRIGMGVIEVIHGPVPWWGNKSLPAADIEQAYCKENIHHSKNGTSYSYDLRVQTRDGKDSKLVSGFSKAEQVLFLEQEIERFLGIQDRIVDDEHGKG